jgi:hypothetical protein
MPLPLSWLRALSFIISPPNPAGRRAFRIRGRHSIATLFPFRRSDFNAHTTVPSAQAAGGVSMRQQVATILLTPTQSVVVVARRHADSDLRKQLLKWITGSIA